MSPSKFTPREQMVRALTTGKPKKIRENVRGWAEDMTEDDMKCRGLYHEWEDLSSDELRPDLILVYFRCPNCDNSKVVEFTPFGRRLVARTYRDGYLCAPGAGRATQKAVALMTFTAVSTAHKRRKGKKKRG